MNQIHTNLIGRRVLATLNRNDLYGVNGKQGEVVAVWLSDGYLRIAVAFVLDAVPTLTFTPDELEVMDPKFS
jgi:hypothetical protein